MSIVSRVLPEPRKQHATHNEHVTYIHTPLPPHTERTYKKWPSSYRCDQTGMQTHFCFLN